MYIKNVGNTSFSFRKDNSLQTITILPNEILEVSSKDGAMLLQTRVDTKVNADVIHVIFQEVTLQDYMAFLQKINISKKRSLFSRIKLFFKRKK